MFHRPQLAGQGSLSVWAPIWVLTLCPEVGHNLQLLNRGSQPEANSSINSVRPSAAAHSSAVKAAP